MPNHLAKILRNPTGAFAYGISLLIGFFYRLYYMYILRKASFGSKLRVRGWLSIKGPGKVIVGDNVLFDGRGHPVTPFTHHKDAVISIASNSFVNGTRFGCMKRITVGEWAILGDARIMDTDFHSIDANRWDPKAEIATKPVVIEDNVWIGGASAILKGVHIGRNSVIGFGSVVVSDVPANRVVAGNPAVLVKRLDSAEEGGGEYPLSGK